MFDVGCLLCSDGVVEGDVGARDIDEVFVSLCELFNVVGCGS